MTVSNGGTANAFSVTISGFFTSGVTGANSRLTTSSLTLLGGQFLPAFGISQGGLVSLTGDLDHSNRAISITGNGSSLQYTGDAHISGTGSITVGGGASQSMTGSVSLNNSGSIGVTGSGSDLQFAGSLTIGANGTTTDISSASVSEGATMTAHEEVIVGDQSNGAIRVFNGTFTADHDVTIGRHAFGTLSVSSGATNKAIINGILDIGGADNGSGFVTVNGELDAKGGVHVANPGVPANASGSLNVTAGGKAVIDHTLTIGGRAMVGDTDREPSHYGTGSVTVDGANSTLTFSGPRLVVGGAVATTNNADGEENGTDGKWGYAGGKGTLTISGGATVIAQHDLELLARVDIAADGTQTPQGGIFFQFGGRLEIGGTQAPLNNNVLQIDAGGHLFGHGMIDSDVTGQLPVGQINVPTYALTVINKGTIEARDGLLVIHGSVISDEATSEVKIAANSTLELGGSFSGSIDLGGVDNGTLVLDNPVEFSLGHPILTLKGLSDGGDEDGGDVIILKNTSFANGNAIVAATMGKRDGVQPLQIWESATNTPQSVSLTMNIPIEGAEGDGSLLGDYLRVSKGGPNDEDTILTLTHGNPIALSVDAVKARHDFGVDGTGITIGIISGGFGSFGADQAAGVISQNITILPIGLMEPGAD